MALPLLAWLAAGAAGFVPEIVNTLIGGKSESEARTAAAPKMNALIAKMVANGMDRNEASAKAEEAVKGEIQSAMSEGPLPGWLTMAMGLGTGIGAAKVAGKYMAGRAAKTAAADAGASKTVDAGAAKAVDAGASKAVDAGASKITGKDAMDGLGFGGKNDPGMFPGSKKSVAVADDVAPSAPSRAVDRDPMSWADAEVAPGKVPPRSEGAFGWADQKMAQDRMAVPVKEPAPGISGGAMPMRDDEVAMWDRIIGSRKSPKAPPEAFRPGAPRLEMSGETRSNVKSVRTAKNRNRGVFDELDAEKEAIKQAEMEAMRAEAAIADEARLGMFPRPYQDRPRFREAGQGQWALE